jgi:hypothetical protein
MLRREFGIWRRTSRSGQPTGASLGSTLLLASALLGAALLLAGCQVPQTHLNAAAAPSPAPQAQPQLTSSPSKPKPVPLVATPAVAHGGLDVAPNTRLSGDPKELLGLDHAAVRRALGDPTRIRSEDPAQVWQYVNGDCVVDLYLYAESGALKVTYVEARSHTAEQAPTGRCLKLLLERPTASAE